jgi:release factor glutamine methyltransferase
VSGTGDGDGDDRSSADRLAERRGLETEVYGPAEDSGLLAAAAAAEVTADDRVLEVGVGSGWVAERVGAATGARVIGIDVDADACRAARGRGVETVRGDLVGPVAGAAFDAVLFNPPYLPIDPETAAGDPLLGALSGGATGRAVIEPFLDGVGRVLAPGGRVLLVVSSLTGREAVAAYARERGFEPAVVREERYPFERLVVLRLARRDN